VEIDLFKSVSVQSTGRRNVNEKHESLTQPRSHCPAGAHQQVERRMRASHRPFPITSLSLVAYFTMSMQRGFATDLRGVFAGVFVPVFR
jgi:hypothetical protein